MNDKIITTIESYGFAIYNKEPYNDIYYNELYYVDIGQYTPCGEDWWVTILFDGTNAGFIKAVREAYNDFDIDEAVEIWIESRGKNGVPSSIKALVQDAEWKKSMLEELADSLEELNFNIK